MASTQKKVKEKEVIEQKGLSKKGLIILTIIAVVGLVSGYFIHRYQQTRDAGKYVKSYLIDSDTVNLEIKSLEEVNQVLSEAPNDYFVLITYNENKATYELETGLKTVIDKYKFNDAFYYFDVKDLLNDTNYLQKLNNAFNTDKITTVPVILYYKDGKLEALTKRYDENIINAGDFQHLLDIYYEDR